jgi:hypothetical protein
MKGRGAILGLCMACALLASAVVASGAQGAAEAFTCSPEAKAKEWAGAHCNGAEGSGYGHESFGSTKTALSGEAGALDGGKQRLKTSIFGANMELVANGVSFSGVLEQNNGTTVSGSGTLTFTEVSVAAPAGKGCKVYTDNSGSEGEEGVVHTNKLSITTTNPGELKITPAEGETLATFFIRGCESLAIPTTSILNGTQVVTGSLTVTPNGGEVTATHTGVTTQGTLKVSSLKAGLNGSLTIKGENGNALALT